MLRLGAVGAAADGAGAGRRSGQQQWVPRSVLGRTTAATATVIRLTAMATGPATTIRVMAMPLPATRVTATAMAMGAATVTQAKAMAPATATRLMAMATELSAAVSMPLVGVI